MDPRFFLKTLGTPELREVDGAPVRFKVRKHLALLIYLAVDYRRSQTRESLVDLFWSGVNLERGRHSLSVALSVLRSALGSPAIQSNNTTVRLNRCAITLDLDLLERGIILTGAGLAPLEVDRFLRDFEIDDAPAFQHWRDRQHAQLQPSIHAAFLTLADHARRSGDMRQVLTFAERLLALDPLSEEGIRAKILALAMQGDRVSALRCYEAWREELKGQLGAVPSELLEGIAARLRRRATERTHSAPSPVSEADQWADRRFVGRAAEYRELVDAWECTIQFNTRHIVLTGESGIGKSTLAMRFGASVALEGAAVARVQCFELEQRIAFGMIGALVSDLLDKPGAIATAPESLAEIARIVPKVRQRFPGLPAPRRAEGETARMHFAEGVFALFEAIMEEQPLLLIVDDYPRSDEASLSVLHMLLRRAGTDRAMVVLTGRPAEAGEPAQVRRIREGVSYLPMRHVELSPLTEEEGDLMLNALLNGKGKEVAAPIRRAILQAGRGNPMALDLLAQDWAAHGEAALAISLPAMSSDMPASALEAVGYDRLIERMLPDLAPRSRAALQLAAILGPRLNDLDCFDIAGLTPPQTVAGLTDLVGRRLLRDVGGRLEFTNELIRARVYLKIPSSARTRMHDGVANRLLVGSAVGESVPGLEIAWHCIRAKRREEATPYLMSGAREAILHGAPDEAVRALSSALGHLKGNARNEAAVLLAESHQEMGDWKLALVCLEDLQKNRKGDDYVLEMARLLAIESRRQIGEFSNDELDSIARELTESALSGTGELVIRIQTALTAARIAGSLAAKTLLEPLVGMLETVPTKAIDQRWQTKLLLAKGYTQYHLRRNAEGHSKTLAGALLLKQNGAADTSFVLLQTGLAAFGCVNGRYAEAAEYFETAFRAALKLDNLALASQAANGAALCSYRLGRAEEQVRWALIARSFLSTSLPGSYNHVDSAAHWCFGSLSLGKIYDVNVALDQLQQARRQAVLPWIHQSAMFFEADIHWLMGAKRAAFATLRKSWGSRPTPPVAGYEGKFARWTTLLLCEEGRLTEAKQVLNSFYKKIEGLDMIDRAEILCSMEYIRHLQGATRTLATDLAREVLAGLPVPCSIQIEQLGLRLPYG